jgi:hypothetical protein
VAREHGVSRGYVSRKRADVLMAVPAPKTGRPRKLTAADRRKAARLVRTGECDTAADVAKELNGTLSSAVSPQTVRRALGEEGYKAIVAKKKPRLTKKHITNRLLWAQKHAEWTVDDWKRVIWSDETKINRVGSDGKIYKYIKKGETGLEKHNARGTLKFGGGNIMIWGSMLHAGVGFMMTVDGRMNSEQYTSILGSCLPNVLAAYELEKENVIFQQDNDPKHTSNHSRQWFETEQYAVLDWPAQSPDLNPIEHLWFHIKRELAKADTDAKSYHELKARVEAIWSKVPDSVCANLVESMPRRIAAVLAAKGGHTKY